MSVLKVHAVCKAITEIASVASYIRMFICDRICKKGSYTRTTSEHRFHHHSMDTSSDNPCVHVLWPTVYQSAFS